MRVLAAVVAVVSIAIVVAASASAIPARTTTADRSAAPAGVRFRVTLTAQNRRPRAGARWWYVVRAVRTDGKRFSGTAIMRVVAGGKVIDTIGWFGFKGRLLRTYRFNSILKGKRATLQAKVIGPGGKRIVGYLVRVR